MLFEFCCNGANVVIDSRGLRDTNVASPLLGYLSRVKTYGCFETNILLKRTKPFIMISSTIDSSVLQFFEFRRINLFGSDLRKNIWPCLDLFPLVSFSAARIANPSNLSHSMEFLSRRNACCYQTRLTLIASSNSFLVL